MTGLSTEPVELSPEQRERIAVEMATCPFVGSAVAGGFLDVLNAAREPLARISDVAALGDRGGGDLGTRVLSVFARGNHAVRVLGDNAGERVPAATFSLQFGGSQGAHWGHSGILLGDPRQVDGGRLDQARLDRLAGRVDRHGRLSIDVVGDFIAENLKADPHAQVLPAARLLRDAVRLLRGLKHVLLGDEGEEEREAWAAFTKLLGEDHLVASAGEWGLLFAFLKNSPRSEGLDIAFADAAAMFADKRLPDGWETWKKRASDWVIATLRLTKDATLAYHFGVA